MPPKSAKPNSTANDNLVHLKPLPSTSNRSFDPSDFERLMDQKLSETKKENDSVSDQPICHVY